MNKQTLKDIDRTFEALDIIEDIKADIEEYLRNHNYSSYLVDAVNEIIDRYIKEIS